MAVFILKRKPTQLHSFDDYDRQILKNQLISLRESLPRFIVDQAQAAQHMTAGGYQRRPGIKANIGSAYYQGV
ncbi:hypothetical protein PSE10A_05560 [Pseudomonas amygdali pv. eriobotryae]|uniref:Uncharacterized protein n=1 Tax=Pseudomonas amygdali pv. eriobotryae TaxID=129137 RepID=A0A9P3A9Z9_PSEA0|nr:hypothetical protein PSE10A_05560 [Pseudomonas amygdali pv. eriobotryae]